MGEEALRRLGKGQSLFQLRTYQERLTFRVKREYGGCASVSREAKSLQEENILKPLDA